MKRPRNIETPKAAQSPTLRHFLSSANAQTSRPRISQLNITDFHDTDFSSFTGDALEYEELFLAMAAGTYEQTEEEEAYPLTAFMIASVAEVAIEQNRASIRGGDLTKLRKSARDLMSATFAETLYLCGSVDMLLATSAKQTMTQDDVLELAAPFAAREDELIRRVATGAHSIIFEIVRQLQRKGKKGRPTRAARAVDLAKLLDNEMIARARTAALPSDRADPEKIAAMLPLVVRAFVDTGKLNPLHNLGETKQENVDRHVRRLRRHLLSE